MDTNNSTTQMKRCTKCGETKPRDGFGAQRSRKDGLRSWCKTCRNEEGRRWYEENIEKERERKRRWREANPDHNRHYYEANTHKVKEQIHRYCAENREKIREKNRRWREANPDSVRGYHHNRRARESGSSGTYTPADLAAIRAAQTDKRGRLICWKCGKPIKDTPHLDHWIPLVKGGTNDAGNLHYMHATCNLSKQAKHPTEIGRLL